MGIENIDGEKLSGWAAFINNLTAKKIFLTIALALGLVLTYAIYEDKTVMYQTLTANPTLAASLAGGAFLIMIGFAFMSLQTRIDEKSKEIQDELRDRLTYQHEQHKDTIKSVEAQLLSLERRERECVDRFHSLTLLLAKRGFFKDSDVLV